MAALFGGAGKLVNAVDELQKACMSKDKET
jgi:hypothetical protein